MLTITGRNEILESLGDFLFDSRLLATSIFLTVRTQKNRAASGYVDLIFVTNFSYVEMISRFYETVSITAAVGRSAFAISAMYSNMHARQWCQRSSVYNVDDIGTWERFIVWRQNRALLFDEAISDLMV